MAGDWIKLECTTPDKPEIVHMAAQLRIDQDAVMGKLMRVWVWANQNCVAGEGMTITAAFLDRLACWPGFAAAMREVGWLVGDDGAMAFPNFQRHNGTTAKKRAETNRRMGKLRVKREVGDANVTLRASQKASPEKRRGREREEEECTEESPKAGVSLQGAREGARAPQLLRATREPGEGQEPELELRPAREPEGATRAAKRAGEAVSSEAAGSPEAGPALEPARAPEPQRSRPLYVGTSSARAEMPTLEEALQLAPTAGISPRAAECWWLDCDARLRSPGGHFTDIKGNEIRNWRSAMTSYGRKWQDNEIRHAQYRARPGRQPTRASAALIHDPKDTEL